MGKRWCIGMVLFLLLVCASGVLAAGIEEGQSGALAGLSQIAPAAEEPEPTATPPWGISFLPLRQEIALGETTTVTIRATDVISLYGVQVNMHFDPAMLAVVDADPHQEGIQIATGDFIQRAFTLGSANNQTGNIYFAASFLSPELPVTGTGTIAIITYQTLRPGAAATTIRSAGMFQFGPKPRQPVVGEDAIIEVIPPYAVSLPLALKAFAP